MGHLRIPAEESQPCLKKVDIYRIRRETKLENVVISILVFATSYKNYCLFFKAKDVSYLDLVAWIYFQLT